MPPETDNVTDARAEGLKHFPATIDFVHLQSVDFDAHRLPPRVTGSDETFMPSSWEMTISVQDVTEGRYMVEVGAEAVFEGGESDNGNPEDASGSGYEETPYDLSLAVVAGLRIEGEVSEDIVQNWLDKGAQYLLIPYLRSFVSSVVRDSGFDVPYFPLLSVPVLYGEEESNRKEASASDQ